MKLKKKQEKLILLQFVWMLYYIMYVILYNINYMLYNVMLYYMYR